MLALLPLADAASFLLLSPCCPQNNSPFKLERACRRLGAGFQFYSSLNASALGMAEKRLQSLQRAIRSSPAPQTLVIGGYNVEPAPHCLHWRLKGREPFRVLATLAPEYRILFIPSKLGDPLLQAYENRISYLRPEMYVVPEGVRRVVLTVDGLGLRAPKGLPLQKRLQGGQTYFEGVLRNEFSYLGVRFIAPNPRRSQ